ncbi:MAG: 3-hydroxyacyl-CoA dehydrogenase [Polyangiales bacterium]
MADVLAVSRQRPPRVQPGYTPTAEPQDSPVTHMVSADVVPSPSAANLQAGSGPDGAAGSPAASPRLPVDPTITDDAVARPLVPFLFWADIVNNNLWRSNIDGSERAAVTSSENVAAPDGVAVDPEDRYVYWTNMGNPVGGSNAGTVRRMQLDTQDVQTVVPVGITNTPKQLRIDPIARKLYWADREGAKVWRSSLDGSDVEVLVRGHDLMQLVGLALDVQKRQFYFSDRMARKIFRASFDMPPGRDADTRADVETLLSFDVASMPLDLELDLEERLIYWTDRMRGTIQRAPMEPPAELGSAERTDIDTLVANLVEPIGLSLDHVDHRMYFSQLSGEIGRVDLHGEHLEVLVTAGSASGLTLAHLPK